MVRSLWLGIGAAATLSAAVLAWVFWPTPEPEAGPGDVTRSAEANGVTVTATWLPSGDTDRVSIRILLDTHTVDLAFYDLGALVRLDKEGATRIASVDEPTFNARDNHHVDAFLWFPVTQPPFDLVVEDLGGVPERRLTFE